MDKFPKYIKVRNTELIKLSESLDKAIYYRPCGEWKGTLIYDSGKYNFDISGVSHWINVTIEEITAKEFLLENPYAYSVIGSNCFLSALGDLNLDKTLIKSNEGKITHCLSK
jgi:hypothetical protein